MPIYEYVCKKCAHPFEVMQKISDPPAEKCPSCGGAVEKKLSLSSFQLKGTGWYVTDYARKEKEKKEKKEAKDTKEKGEKKEKPEASSTPSAKEPTPAKLSSLTPVG